MRGRPIARRATGLLVAALGLSPLAAAAQETVDLPGVFSEVVDVRVVNVEVVVTDAEGRRVTALRREDFRVTVDGVERPIDFWSEIRDGEEWEAERPDSAALDDGGPDQRADGELRAGEAHSTSYLVFIDDSFTRSRDRNLVLEQLASELEGLGPRDRMAVVAFDGRELTLLSPWTTSTRVLAGALRDARARPSSGAEREQERRLNEAIHTGGGGRHLSGLQHRYALRLGNQVERAVMAAVASLRSFASPPGRKVMVLVAGGWPVSPAEYAVSRPTEDALEDAYAAGVLGYDALFGPLVDSANLLGYTLYPVDVAGSAGRIEPDTPVGLLGEGGDRSFWGPDGNLHAGMRYLAEKTGGRAVVNEERTEALARVAADTRSYYWLGLRLDRAGDDARHQVRVEVLRPGLVARSREGFVDPSRQSEMTLMAESALLFGTPASALAAQLRFGRPQRARRGLVKLPVEIGFPLDEIAWAAGAGRHSTELALRVAAMDDEGKRAPPVLATVRIDLERPPRPGELYWHALELTLERRWHRIVAGIFDPSSGKIYSSSAEIALRAQKNAG